MSRWNHNICGPCWHKRDPARMPVRLKDASADLCCFCGAENTAGIYVRQDPTTVACEGRYMMHTEAT